MFTKHISQGIAESPQPGRFQPTIRAAAAGRRGPWPCCLLATILAGFPLCLLHAAPAPALIPFKTIRSDAKGQAIQSSMIWAEPGTAANGVAVAFRRSISLNQAPAKACLAIFADARYILWVNGTYVERGPARFQPNGPEYDMIDLTARLKQGTNTLALLVVGNLSGGKIMRHAPGLGAVLEIDGKEITRTDKSWKWSRNTRFQSVTASWADLTDALVDARVEDGDWTAAAYNDSHWKSSVSIDGKAWGPLTSRRIPRLGEKPVPVKLANGASLPVTLAAGQKLEFSTEHIVQAYPVISFTADAGTEMSFNPFKVRYIAKAGPQMHFTIDTKGMMHGEIVVNKGKATITGFRLVERLYPYTRVGSFQCNDGFLNRLWEMCARSCEVLSEDSYVDCADRERVEWMDDDPPGFDITRTVMAGPAGPDGKPAYSDPRLSGEMIRRTAFTLQPDGWVKAHTCSDRYDIHAKMEDRACDWVEGIRRYYEATGDVERVREIWPAVVAQMDYFLKRRGDHGLISARDWVVWGNPLGYITGQTTTLNVFVYRALADSAYLGGLIGQNEDGARFAKAAEELAGAINRVLWDDKAGDYYSGYFSAADLKTTHDSRRSLKLPVTNGLTPSTLHANVFALDQGVVPPVRRDKVIAAMLGQIPASPSGSNMIYYYLFKQLYALDKPDLDTKVLSDMRSGWKAMVAGPYQCSWESFGGGSKAHIYGMYPAYFLGSYVLGVRWADGVPLNRKLLIQPHLGDLKQADGTVMTEAGPVAISWKRDASGALEFRGKVPDGVTACLSLPAGPSKRFTLGGASATGKQVGNRFCFLLPAGEFSGTAN